VVVLTGRVNAQLTISDAVRSGRLAKGRGREWQEGHWADPWQRAIAAKGVCEQQQQQQRGANNGSTAQCRRGICSGWRGNIADRAGGLVFLPSIKNWW
jgi:hypothetical protein